MSSIAKQVIVLLFIYVVSIPGLFGQLTTTITNIKEIKGNIEFGIYDDPEVFLSDTEQYEVIYMPVDQKTIVIIIDSLPKGTYAISLMHDLNNDGEMESNFFHIPKEPYGFSNNFRPRFSKPDFEDCQFYYNGESLELSIELVH